MLGPCCDPTRHPYPHPPLNFNLCLPTAPSLWTAGWWGTECVSAVRTPSFRKLVKAKGFLLTPHSQESCSSVLGLSLGKDLAPTLPVVLLCLWSLGKSRDKEWEGPLMTEMLGGGPGRGPVGCSLPQVWVL